MALTGKLYADFSNFTAAVASAEVSLKGFESGSSKVASSLTRMTNSLSGQKVVQDATLMVEAIERIGGVSKLTASELAKFSAQAAEAAEKLRAMGKDVPAKMQAIADKTKEADDAQQGLGATVKQVTLAFAGMFTLQAAANFVKKIIDDAGALKDLATQTHMNVEELQALGGAMSTFGVSTEELGKALFGLSRSIAGGDESVAHALHVMGLSLKDVEGLEGEALFLKIENGLAKLQGSLRDTTASDLFGAKLGMALAGASEGIEGALEAERKLATFSSTEAVDAIDEFAESVDRSSRSISAIATNMIGPLAQGFNVVVDSANRTGVMATFWAMMRDGVGSSGPLSKWALGTDNLARLLDKANQAQEAATRAATADTAARTETVATINAQTDAQRFLAALQKDASEPLTKTQRADLAHLKEMNALNAKNALGIGVSTAQYAKYTAEVERAKKISEAWNDVLEDAADNTLQEFEERLKKVTEAMKEETKKQKEAILDEVAALNTLANAMQASLWGAPEIDHQGNANAQIERFERQRGALGDELTNQGQYLTIEQERRRQERAQPTITTTNNINMTGLLATSDPSGKAALRSAVDEALIAGAKQGRKF